MVGIPKSKRCSFCRARKTKCDEKWPTCGACARAGKICSGARSTFKFVVNGNHSETPSADGDEPIVKNQRRTPTPTPSPMFGSKSVESSRRPSPAPSVVVELSSHSALSEHGLTRTSFSECYRAVAHPMAWRPTEKLIAKVISCLRSAPGTGDDLRIVGAFLPLLPQFLGNGQHIALEHALELLIGAWTNTRRGLPPNSWLDLRTYNQALRSLKDALDDGRVEELTYTMAAQCILQKTEVLYDFSRGSNQENHAAGLIAVYKGKGPDPCMTEVDLHVFFESLFHMLQEEARQGRTSDFSTLEWITTLRQAVHGSSLEYIFKQTYSLWVEGTRWPDCVRMVRLLCQDPSHTATATELREKVISWMTYLQHQDQTVLDTLIRNGDIIEVGDGTNADVMARWYEFIDYPTAKLFTSHAMFSIIACRALKRANRVLDIDDPTTEKQARFYSRRIWMSHPWMKAKTPMSVDFTGPLVFSYESGNEQEREYCRKSLDEMESFRQPPPIGVWSKETIMANAKAYTGLLPFIKTQDSKVEYDRIGCRS